MQSHQTPGLTQGGPGALSDGHDTAFVTVDKLRSPLGGETCWTERDFVRLGKKARLENFTEAVAIGRGAARAEHAPAADRRLKRGVAKLASEHGGANFR